MTQRWIAASIAAVVILLVVVIFATPFGAGVREELFYRDITRQFAMSVKQPPEAGLLELLRGLRAEVPFTGTGACSMRVLEKRYGVLPGARRVVVAYDPRGARLTALEESDGKRCLLALSNCVVKIREEFVSVALGDPSLHRRELDVMRRGKMIGRVFARGVQGADGLFYASIVFVTPGEHIQEGDLLALPAGKVQ